MNAFSAFYDAVNMIHDVIRRADPFPYTDKSMFAGVRNNKIQQIRKINRIHRLCCRISKVSNSVWRNDNFLAKARKLSIFQPR